MPQINDDSINSVLNLDIVNYNVSLATQTTDGLMSAEDYIKLNELVYPYPTSTIRGEDCGLVAGSPVRFTKGNIDLYGSNYIQVEGTLDLKNINHQGDNISESQDFHIHTHTFGYDFKVDLNSLFSDLESIGKIVIQGRKGDKGKKGNRGVKGKDRVLSGPQGDRGDDGKALPCSLSLQPETIENTVKQGMSQAIVGAYIKEDPLNAKKYKLVFIRKYVGKSELEADKMKVNGANSKWLLVSNQNNGISSIYFIDIDPILLAMKEQYERRINYIKEQYEQKVEKWVQAMSDMFDQQKTALCCALKYCLSSKQNTETRRHIESLAATALPDKVVDFCDRSSSDAIFTTPDENCIDNASDCYKKGIMECGDQQTTTQKLSAASNTITVSGSINNNSITAAIINLDPGQYTLILTDTNIKNNTVNDEYLFYPNIKVKSGQSISSFMNKGEYVSEEVASEMYVGLSTTIDHSGGNIYIWHDSGTNKAYGTANLNITKFGESKNILVANFSFSEDDIINIFNTSNDRKSIMTTIGSQEYLVALLKSSDKYYKELVLGGVDPIILIPVIDDMPVKHALNYHVSLDVADIIKTSVFKNDYYLVGYDVPKFSSCLIPNAN